MRASTAVAILTLIGGVALSVALPLPGKPKYVKPEDQIRPVRVVGPHRNLRARPPSPAPYHRNRNRRPLQAQTSQSHPDSPPPPPSSQMQMQSYHASTSSYSQQSPNQVQSHHEYYHQHWQPSPDQFQTSQFHPDLLPHSSSQMQSQGYHESTSSYHPQFPTQMQSHDELTPLNPQHWQLPSPGQGQSQASQFDTDFLPPPLSQPQVFMLGNNVPSPPLQPIRPPTPLPDAFRPRPDTSPVSHSHQTQMRTPTPQDSLWHSPSPPPFQPIALPKLPDALLPPGSHPHQPQTPTP